MASTLFSLRNLAINAGLAALATFTGAIAGSEGAITRSLLIAAGYTALRVAAGFIASGLGTPVPVDEE